MAEETSGAGTLAPSGQETPAPGQQGPSSSPAPPTAPPSTMVDIPQASSPDTASGSARDAELSELRTLSERYKQQLQGWEAESRRHQDENRRMQEQLRAYDTYIRQMQAQPQPQPQSHLQSQPSQTNGRSPQATNAPRSFKDAMDRYLAGDDTALDTYAQTNQSQAGPEQIAQVVDERLNNYLSYMGKQQAVTQAHPELTDRTHPLYKEAYDLYDTVAADPLSRVLYPDDPSMQVSIISPDGSSQKPMDLRILNAAVMQAKARQGVYQEQNRRNGAGDAMTANGAQVSSRSNAVEALELFDAAEQREWMQQIQARALPAHWPKEPRQLARFLWDGLSAVEKAKRLEAYQTRTARGR